MQCILKLLHCASWKKNPIWNHLHDADWWWLFSLCKRNCKRSSRPIQSKRWWRHKSTYFKLWLSCRNQPDTTVVRHLVSDKLMMIQRFQSSLLYDYMWLWTHSSCSLQKEVNKQWCLVHSFPQWSVVKTPSTHHIASFPIVPTFGPEHYTYHKSTLATNNITIIQ